MEANPTAQAPAQPEHIPYATPASRHSSRATPAVWIALIGLALIGLGGCFMIGVMITLGVTGSSQPMTPGIGLFLVLLYTAAFGCFGGAIILVIQGVRALFSMLDTDHHHQ